MILAIVIWVLSFSLHAADVELESDFYVDDDVITTAFAVQDNGADGSSESSQIEVYVPFKTEVDIGAGISEENYSYYTTLPYVDTTGVFSGAGGANPCLYFAVSNNASDTDYDTIQIMAKDGDDEYQAIAFSNVGCTAAATATDTSMSLASGSTITIYVSWEKIVTAADGSVDTSTWEDADISESFDLYAPILETADPDIDSSDADNGLFINVEFNSKQPDTAATLYELKKGDTQLTLSYDASNAYENDFLEILFISATAPTGGVLSWKSFVTSPNGEILKNTDAEISGEYKISGLTNEKVYSITVAVRDVFYFISPLARTLENTPQELKAFIQEKSCYLLSAGFQTDHPVLEFFRHWRDHTLSKWAWGKLFIQWYYRTAPQYTQAIIDHPALALAVRMLGHVAYVVVRFFWWWMGLFGILGLVLLYSKWRRNYSPSPIS